MAKNQKDFLYKINELSNLFNNFTWGGDDDDMQSLIAIDLIYENLKSLDQKYFTQDDDNILSKVLYTLKTKKRAGGELFCFFNNSYRRNV